MKKLLMATLVVVAIGLLAYGIDYYYKNLRGFGPAFYAAPKDIRETFLPENNTDFPLTLPKDFGIEIFADNVPGARVMAIDGRGNMWVSQRNEGTVSLVTIEDGKVTSQNAVLRGLNNPHGLAFDPQDPFLLYIAEEDKISLLRTYSEAPLEKIIDLPNGGRHTTRTLMFGSDDRLYVSIGSSCDVCHEEDERLATIYSMQKDGSDFKQFAKGLRNAVFMATNPVDGKIWATEMGRDGLGDDIPPDEINIIEEGKNYGWPICYGKNIHDTQFDKNTYIRNPCQEPFETPSYIDLQAHSAPLGLAFVPEEGWPEELWYNLLVAYHGSWNRTEPTGYKISRIKLDVRGNYLGEEDFISGWLTKEGALGRPVDILIQPGGIMYISDDKAGVVYRLFYNNY